MNKFDLAALVSLIVVVSAGVYVYLPIEAQEQQAEIEEFTEADKAKDFQVLDFEFYLRASNLQQAKDFLNNVETERKKEILKKLWKKADVQLYCEHETFGEIYRGSGMYIFKQEVSAQKVKNWFKNNLPLNIIDYGKFTLTWNNHHADTLEIHPDIIIEEVIYGNENQYIQVTNDCFFTES